MKRLLLSILTVGLVSAGAFAATRAYFTAEASIQGATITTGNVAIKDVSDRWMLPVVFENVKPGDKIRKWVVFQNDGTIDIGTLKISAVNKTGDLDLFRKLNVSVYNTVTGYSQGIYTPDWGKGQPLNTSLKDLDVLGTAVYRDDTAAHELKVGEKATIILDFYVPSTLGNNFQNTSTSFDIVFTAEQVH